MGYKWWLLAIAALLVSASVAAYAIRVSDDCLRLADHPDAWRSVTEHWAKGEVVTLVRHTTDCDPDKVSDCINGNEYLTPVGLEQAGLIGEGFRQTLHGEFTVSHSRLDRTTTTAMIVFGESTEDPRVTKPCKTTFQTFVDDLPSDSNHVFVTHSSCINAIETHDGERALGINASKDPHFGITAFFRNHDDKPDELLGCVWPADWDSLPRTEPTHLATR